MDFSRLAARVITSSPAYQARHKAGIAALAASLARSAHQPEQCKGETDATRLAHYRKLQLEASTRADYYLKSADLANYYRYGKLNLYLIGKLVTLQTR